jgi:dihydrofolate synthase/folylpolyglutamate synthase
MKLGLDNITRLLGRVGNPHEAFPAVLVAGTNGKGSVTTYITSILRAAGCTVGTFYSPHIFRIQERIRLNGEEIPTPDLDSVLGRLRAEHRLSHFTFFEGMTAAAALYFKERGVDIAVFEVGLGGRLDATRLVNAAVTVVTGISKDHTAHLGSSRSRILDEKLGIARRNVPLVANLGYRRLAGRAARRCAAIGAPFIDVRAEVGAAIESLEPKRMFLTLETPVRGYGALETRMIGAVQVQNAATAVRAVEILGDFFGDTRGGPDVESDVITERLLREGWRASSRNFPVRITAEAIREGVRRAFLPCRFQALAGDPRIVLDVSHNEEGLLAVLDTLRRISRRNRNILVFGVMEQKELGRFPRRSAALFRDIICTSLRNGCSVPGARLATIFRNAAEAVGRENVNVIPARGMAEALRVMRRIAHPGDTVVICGSHYTVEEAVEYL